MKCSLPENCRFSALNLALNFDLNISVKKTANQISVFIIGCNFSADGELLHFLCTQILRSDQDKEKKGTSCVSKLKMIQMLSPHNRVLRIDF